MSFLEKLVDETKKILPPEATRHHNSIKLLILLSLRADLLYILHYETPCIYLRLMLSIFMLIVRGCTFFFSLNGTFIFMSFFEA